MDGWKMFNDKCYKYITERKSLVDAQNFCRSFHNGDLVSITSRQIGDFLRSYTDIDDGIWTGAFYAESDDWVWSDNSRWGYTNWNRGQPDIYGGGYLRKNVRLLSNGRWSVASSDTLREGTIKKRGEPSF